MKNQIICLAFLLALVSCKGPGTRPMNQEGSPAGSKVPESGTQTHTARVEREKTNINIEPCIDCISVAGLMENKKSYSGKTVKVRGKVTKFNPEIMGKNWVHIQDGTQFNETFDLTVTTGINVQVGDTVIFEGMIELDRDFGYGYVYNVLMVDGKVVR